MSDCGATIDYIGWIGHANLGDEVCLAAIQDLLGRKRRVALRPTHDPTSSVVVLGGGTLLYGADFLKAAERAVRRGARLYVFGSGVDLQLPIEQWGERKLRWSRLLRAARFVGVRGPRSLEAVRQLGIPMARVIGDPGLAIDVPTPANGQRQTDLVLLNAGSDAPPPGGVRRLLDECGRLVKGLFAAGYRVEYVAFRSNDVERARPLVERYRLPVIPAHGPSVLEAVSRSRFLVGTRLHAAVLAAACGVPPVLLGYHAKHRDFAASIDWENGLHSAETFAASDVLASVQRLEEGCAAAVEHLRHATSCYRELQLATAELIQEDVEP